MRHPCLKCGSIEINTKGLCRGCIRAAHARWRARNQDKIKSRGKAYIENNREAILKRRAEKRAENADQRRLLDALWRYNNPEKACAKTLKWQRKNPDKASASCAKHRSSKMNATPIWANEFFIKEAYHLARIRTKITGIKWHVDHVIPLQSKIVCGLHVEMNLEVITAIQNTRKGNRFWPGMP